MQSREPGETYREVTYLSSDLSWAAPPYAYACGCVLAYADKQLTIFNTYAHPTDQPIAHLRGQHPMTAKWGADSRVDDDVMCRVEEGGATAGGEEENQGKKEQQSCRWARPIRFRSNNKQNTVFPGCTGSYRA